MNIMYNHLKRKANNKEKQNRRLKKQKLSTTYTGSRTIFDISPEICVISCNSRLVFETEVSNA